MDIPAPGDGRTPGKSGTVVPHSKTQPRLRTLLPSSGPVSSSNRNRKLPMNRRAKKVRGTSALTQ